MATIMLSPHRTHPTTIISLPQEILDRVIGYVADDLTSLNALGRICKSLHPLCQQTMYKSVRTMDHPSLIEALSLPHNACSVHVLQVVSLRHLRDMLARHTCLPMLRQLTVQEDAFKKPPNWNNVSTQFQKQILNLLGSTTLRKVLFPARLSSDILRETDRITNLRLYLDDTPVKLDKENTPPLVRHSGKPFLRSSPKSLLITGSRRRLTKTTIPPNLLDSSIVDVGNIHAFGILGSQIADMSAVQRILEHLKIKLRHLLIFIGSEYPSTYLDLSHFPKLKSFHVILIQPRDLQNEKTCLIDWIAHCVSTAAPLLKSIKLFPWLTHNVGCWRWAMLQSVLITRKSFSELEVVLNGSVVQTEVIQSISTCLPMIEQVGKLNIRAVKVNDWMKEMREGF